MGLRSEIIPEIVAAFNGDLADAVQPFTGLRKVAVDGDWLNNTVGSADLTYTGRGVFDRFTAREADGDIIRMDDIKLLCLQAELTEQPQMDDRINGYRVVSVQKGDPADITLLIQLRKA